MQAGCLPSSAEPVMNKRRPKDATAAADRASVLGAGVESNALEALLRNVAHASTWH